MANFEELISLAEQRFGEHLSDADRKLFEVIASGAAADYSSENNLENDPAHATGWGDERVLLGDRIAWLCTDPAASAVVMHRGIAVRGARIEGSLELDWARCPFPLAFARCAFTGPINLCHASITGLDLESTHTKAVNADGLKVEGGVCLREGFNADGPVRLLRATIGADLDCSGGTFNNPGAEALSADGLKVEKAVFLDAGFKANGAVTLRGATIGASLSCNRGTFNNHDGHALSADGIKVEGAVLLGAGFKADGAVRILGATIGADLVCNGGTFNDRCGRALSADRSKVDGSVFLGERFKADGAVRLPGAMIGADLGCIGGTFNNPGRDALSASGIKVDGTVALRKGFKADGAVLLTDATIGGNLDCDRGTFHNPGRDALSATRIKVDGTVFLRQGFKADGAVRLRSATIGRNLESDGGTFNNPVGDAFSADELKVDGSVFLRAFRAAGRVGFAAATVGSHFRLEVCKLERTTLDLREATTVTLWDDEESWPSQGHLCLSGLEYEQIRYSPPHDLKRRKDWLCLQSDFDPQPYEQLARSLRAGGHKREARSILIAREDRRTRVSMPWWRKPVSWLNRLSWDYGYRPHMAFVRFSWLPFVVGWALFWCGNQAKVFSPARISPTASDSLQLPVTHQYPQFNSVAYSLDALMPFLNLHQESYWLPDPNATPRPGVWSLSGSGLRIYLWIHIVVGWLLSFLLVTGLTGLVQKE